MQVCNTDILNSLLLTNKNFSTNGVTPFVEKVNEEVKYSQNYHLWLPDNTDTADISKFNDNFNVLDSTMKTLSNTLNSNHTNLSSQLSTLGTKVNTNHTDSLNKINAVNTTISTLQSAVSKIGTIQTRVIGNEGYFDSILNSANTANSINVTFNNGFSVIFGILVLHGQMGTGVTGTSINDIKLSYGNTVYGLLILTPYLWGFTILRSGSVFGVDSQLAKSVPVGIGTNIEAFFLSLTYGTIYVCVANVSSNTVSFKITCTNPQAMNTTYRAVRSLKGSAIMAI